MVHQSYKIAFPVSSEDGSWLIFRLLGYSIHAFLLFACYIFLMTGHATQPTLPLLVACMEK
jgi:hypothetical protein